MAPDDDSVSDDIQGAPRNVPNASSQEAATSSSIMYTIVSTIL